MTTANQLILCPLSPDQTVEDIGALLSGLERLGFIDGALPSREKSYRPGGDFLQLITFLGCSPVVSLGEPGATGDEFCFVEISGSEGPGFLGGRNVKQPRCPACGYRLEQWQDAVAAWEEASPAGYTWQCPSCSGRYALPALKWRQCAGFGRFFLKVWGVFEGEAVPSEALLNHLERSAGFPWTYFYYRA